MVRIKFKLRAIWSILTAQGFYLVSEIDKVENPVRTSLNFHLGAAVSAYNDLHELISEANLELQSKANAEEINRLIKNN